MGNEIKSWMCDIQVAIQEIGHFLPEQKDFVKFNTPNPSSYLGSDGVEGKKGCTSTASLRRFGLEHQSNQLQMKAAIRSRYGPPETLQVKDVPTPSPGDKEMLIRIRACTVNRTDCGNLTGFPFVVRFFTGFPRPRHDSPGSDFAGIVEKTGRLVTRFKTGDRLWGFHDHGLGSHAQFTTVPESTPMAKIPEGFTFSEAASCAEGAHYAFNFINKLDLHAGQKVLLNGATGAIGSAGLQLLKHTGLHVTAVCGTENIGKVKALGADRVVDYKKEDFTRDTERYHFIFDAVGKSTFFKCKHLLLPGGIYISSELGPYGQNIYMTILGAFSSGKKGEVSPSGAALIR